MVSIAILGILSVVVVMDLNSGKRREELQAGVRVLAADLRSLQTRALTAQNVKTCQVALKNVVCEDPAVAATCGTPCAPAPPYGVGMRVLAGGTSYALFADVDASANDWKETPGANEIFLSRSLPLAGGSNVTILDIAAPGPVMAPEVHVAFERQNGRMHINPCAAGPACEVPSLAIRLRHDKSGEIKTVTINAATGRVSVQ